MSKLIKATKAVKTVKPTLKIVIKGEPFDMIKAKTKKIEYREVTQFWISRLYDKNGKKREYEFIEFINGYNKDARRMITKYEGFTKKRDLFGQKVQNGKSSPATWELLKYESYNSLCGLWLLSLFKMHFLNCQRLGQNPRHFQNHKECNCATDSI